MIYQALLLRYSRLTFHRDSILANRKKLFQQNILNQAFLKSINLYCEFTKVEGYLNKYTLFFLKIRFISNTRLTRFVKIRKYYSNSKLEWTEKKLVVKCFLGHILEGRFTNFFAKLVSNETTPRLKPKLILHIKSA